MIQLRDYQQKSIDMLYQWFGEHEGNPCVVLPTGAGKSIVIAAFCRKAIEDYPQTKILMCTHQKELIEQDYAKLVSIWPEADAGVYSAGIGRKELGHTITFAGIQSIYRNMDGVGHVDIVIVDEAHLINHDAVGMYRQLFDKLKEENPYLKVVGFTATPYRLKHGKITDKPAIFSEPLIEPVTITQLQDMGYLCRLRSKKTAAEFDVSKVGTVAGDFNQKQLEEAVDVTLTNEQVVDEVMKRASDRKAWLFFCSGVDHAEHICSILRDKGVEAECVTGKTPKDERERILSSFKEGKIRALTNANVLTTGFDHPGIDCIAMLRPTQSVGLYIQMAGRGLRVSPDKKDCMILDFAGNIFRHGPITNPRTPDKEKASRGPAPMKVCPQCGEIVPLNSPSCPVCFYEWPRKEVEEAEKEFVLHNDDINGEGGFRFVELSSWLWKVDESRNGNRMVTISYYPKSFMEKPFHEYVLLEGVSDWRLSQNMMKLCEYSEECTNGRRIFTHGMPSSVTSTIVDIFNTSKMICCKPCGAMVHREGRYDRVDYVFFGETAKTARCWNVEKNSWEAGT